MAEIEKKMTGKDTLFPNTADVSLFDGPRDPEVNAMMAEIPKDHEGGMPEPERIFGSIPTDNFDAITIPGLAQDLTRVKSAWQDGSLDRTPTRLRAMLMRLLGPVAVLFLAAIALFKRHRKAQS